MIDIIRMIFLFSITLLILFIIIISCMGVFFGGYKEGQIDAALGKQNYYLQTQPDSTKKWVKKENAEEN